MTEEKYLKQRKNEITGRWGGERGTEGGREEGKEERKEGRKDGRREGKMARLCLQTQLEVTAMLACPVCNPGRTTPRRFAGV